MNGGVGIELKTCFTHLVAEIDILRALVFSVFFVALKAEVWWLDLLEYLSLDHEAGRATAINLLQACVSLSDMRLHLAIIGRHPLLEAVVEELPPCTMFASDRGHSGDERKIVIKKLLKRVRWWERVAVDHEKVGEVAFEECGRDLVACAIMGRDLEGEMEAHLGQLGVLPTKELRD